MINLRFPTYPLANIGAGGTEGKKTRKPLSGTERQWESLPYEWTNQGSMTLARRLGPYVDRVEFFLMFTLFCIWFCLI